MKERILIKLSGEALMGNSGYGIDVSTINRCLRIAYSMNVGPTTGRIGR